MDRRSICAPWILKLTKRYFFGKSRNGLRILNKFDFEKMKKKIVINMFMFDLNGEETVFRDVLTEWPGETKNDSFDFFSKKWF